MKNIKSYFGPFININQVINTKLTSPYTVDGRNLILFITQITKTPESAGAIIRIISEGNLSKK